MKIKALALAVIVSTGVMAEEYQTFFEIDYSKFEMGNQSDNAFGLSGTYYFDPQATEGPLSEFSYVNTSGFVGAALYNSDDWDTQYVVGEFFVNNFILGAAYTRAEIANFSANSKTYKLGYLFSDDLVVSFEAVRPSEGDDDQNIVTAQYSHRFNQGDYIGFTVRADDDDYRELSSKYFKTLPTGDYVTAEVTYQDYGSDDITTLEGKYFFGKTTGISAMIDSENNQGVGFEHFFTNNLAVNVDYLKYDDFDANELSVSLVGQF